MDASEIHAKRLNGKEVILPETCEKLQMPSRSWNGTNLWRRSGTENINLDTESTCSRRMSSKTYWVNQKGLHYPRIFKTRIRMPMKHEMISGPSRETSFSAITLNQGSNSNTPREESFPYSTEIRIDVTRVTHTSLDVMQESRIDDYWNIDRIKRFVLVHGQVSHSSPQ